jgi:hypothetical protein
MYITRLASNEIISLSNKIHWEVGRAKDLTAPLYSWAAAAASSLSFPALLLFSVLFNNDISSKIILQHSDK